MRLFELLRAHRDDVVACWLRKVEGRLTPAGVPRQAVLNHLPQFLDGLASAMEAAHDGVAGAEAGPDALAAEHGANRLELGFDVAELVHEYGVLRDCILELGFSKGHPMGRDDLTVLLTTLDAARSTAVSRYAYLRDRELQQQAGMHVAFLAHELRNPLTSARVALAVLNSAGTLPATNRHAEVLSRSLSRIQELVDHSLVDMRLKVIVEPTLERIALAPFLRGVADESSADAEHKRLRLRVEVPPGLEALVDGRLLRSAVSNLLRNAIKFSNAGDVALVARQPSPGRLAIDVTDSCGGLPDGVRERLFDPFVQMGADRSGFGLGLAITKQAVEAHGGVVKVTTVPGKGCIFTIELPNPEATG